MNLAIPRAAGRPTRVLCLGAHSDDIEIGCGGTILSWVEAGLPLDVTWVVLSSDDAREKEARAGAARFLEGIAAKRVVVKRFRNGYFPYVGAEIKDFFETLKADPAPDVIFTHTGDDRHQDHREVHGLTWNTFRSHTILEYEIPKYDGDLGRPNVYVPLSAAVLKKKIAIAMEVFSTQRDKHWFSEDLFSGLARLRGIECCAPEGLAEAFHGRKIVLSAG